MSWVVDDGDFCCGWGGDFVLGFLFVMGCGSHGGGGEHVWWWLTVVVVASVVGLF